MAKRIVPNTDNRVSAWVAARVGRNCPWGPHEAIGLEEDGVLVAGMVAESYVQDTRCCVHLAGIGRNWMTRGYLRFCMSYLFGTLNCKVLIGLVNSDNTDALNFDRHFGWTEACRIKDGAPGCDLVVMEMQRKTCRWIEKAVRECKTFDTTR